MEVHHENSNEHNYASSESVDEELHRSISPVLSAPHQNQQEHWNQGQLPENVEHEQVEYYEDTEQRSLHYEQERME